MTDDQGYGDFSLHGNPHLETPVFDRLARGSVQFERFFVSPSCAPTRAALLTGRYHSRAGVWGVTKGKEYMRPEEVTFAEIFRAAGYRTGMFGKWHNGETFPHDARGQGFDEFVGFPFGHLNNYFDAELDANGAPYRTQGFVTDVRTDEAMRFIERNREQPFVCYLALNAPHEPMQVPEKYFAPMKARGLDDFTAAIYALCAKIDDNLARLLAALDRLKLADDTILLFLTDNGPQTDRFNAGMRGRKGTVHEGGTRVPLVVRYPRRVAGPRIVKPIAAHIDVVPTLLEWCGVRTPAELRFDGRSLVPLIEGRDAAWPDRTLFVISAQGAPTLETAGGLRTQRFRWVHEPKVSAQDQLYDMVADPAQRHDIAAQQPELAAKFRAEYEAWLLDVAQKGFAAPVTEVGHREQRIVSLHPQLARFAEPLRFWGKSGYVHDFLTNWTSLDSAVTWDLRVEAAGNSALELVYRCPEADAGATVRVTIGAEQRETTISGTSMAAVPTADRIKPKDVPPMEWSAVSFGRVTLPAGATTLTLRALTKPGAQVLELKAVRVTALQP